MERVAFVFPGQGSQYTGMGKDLYESFPESKRIFDAADSILDFPLTKLCFNGPDEELTQTINCQPAIFTVSVAALEAFCACGSIPCASYTAGLSLGEYTALVAAGAMTFEDGLSLVALRARAMDEAAAKKPGKMSCILGLGLDKLESIVLESGVQIANLNCPGQVVISGETQAVDKANSLALAHGAKRAIGLGVSGAFHSCLMELAGQKLASAINDINIEKPKITVVSNVTALPVCAPDEIRENLIRQLTGSVFWEKSVRFMIGQGVNRFFEIGPGRVLKGLIRKIDPAVKVISIESREDVAGGGGEWQ